MKNWKRLVAGILVSVSTFVFTVGVVPKTVALADYDVRPTAITIRGNQSTVSVGKKVKLYASLAPYNAEDDYVRWSSSNSAVARVTDYDDDDTSVVGVKAGTAVITASVYGTSIKDTFTVTVTGSAASVSNVSEVTNAKLNAVSAQINALKKEIRSAGSTYSSYRTLKAKLDEIDSQIDLYDDIIEDEYDFGTISRSKYRKLERKIENLENRLDMLEDDLEYKYGIDD